MSPRLTLYPAQEDVVTPAPAAPGLSGQAGHGAQHGAHQLGQARRPRVGRGQAHQHQLGQPDTKIICYYLYFKTKEPKHVNSNKLRTNIRQKEEYIA